MKVSEAEKKVCPFMSGQVATGIEDIVFATVNCICGDCMAWEWTNTHTDIQTIGNGTIPDEGLSFVREWKGPDCITYSQYGKELKHNLKEGYCKRLAE